MRGRDVSLALSRTSDFLSDAMTETHGLGRHHLRSERASGPKGTVNIHLGALATSVGRSIASQLQSYAGVASVLQFQYSAPTQDVGSVYTLSSPLRLPSAMTSVP